MIKIRVGDKVTVHLLDGHRRIVGKVLYTPCQSSDNWIIDSEKEIYYVQQYACISKEKQSNEKSS